MVETDELSDVFERMSDGFFAVDTDWRLTHVNEVARRTLSETADGDVPTDGLVGTRLWDLLPVAVETGFDDRFRESLATQEPATFEEYYEPFDAWFEVRVYPSDSGLSVYFADVTDRREYRRDLSTRERVLREMYEVVADRDKEFAEQVSALLELGREELDTAYGTLSRIEGDDYVFEVVDADDDSITAGDIVPLSATNCELAASREETLVLGDVARDAPEETDRAGYAEWGISCYVGGPVFVDDEVYGTFCFYDTEPRAGQFSDWEVTLVDLMSRWVSYELQHKRTADRLRAQNETLEQFASVVSHDLRSPLEVIRGSIELARRMDDVSQLDRCGRALERMETLIDDLLTLARAGVAVDDLRTVDLAEQATQCWQVLATADASLDITTERAIRADESRLRQLLSNLVRNSVEHGGAGARITVGDLDDGFFVEDDGPGIPSEERDQVFERGYSTTTEGTGFGLAIVREVADAHGWTVTVTAGSDGGARFEVRGVDVVEAKREGSGSRR